MSKIDDLSVNIDSRIQRYRESLPNWVGLDSEPMTKLTLICERLDEYRAEVAKEIEGLKGDVKSAEAAYEREKVRADGLAQEQGRWTNEQLPGWRKRVTDAERANDDLRRTNGALARNVSAERESSNHAMQECEQWKQAHESNVAELKALALHAGDLEQDRDEWKRDAATSEAKLEKAIEERDAYKVQRDGAEIALSKIRKLAEHPDGVVDAEFEPGARTEAIPGCLCSTCQALSKAADAKAGFTPMTPGEFSEKFFGVDPGAREGDKTVITFECCNVTHFFRPPQFGNWNHQAECQECGSLTTFTSAN